MVPAPRMPKGDHNFKSHLDQKPSPWNRPSWTWSSRRASKRTPDLQSVAVLHVRTIKLLPRISWTIRKTHTNLMSHFLLMDAAGRFSSFALSALQPWSTVIGLPCHHFRLFLGLDGVPAGEVTPGERHDCIYGMGRARRTFSRLCFFPSCETATFSFFYPNSPDGLPCMSYTKIPDLDPENE